MRALMIFSAAAIFVSSPALACSFAPPRSDEERRTFAKDTVARASVIADMIVIRGYGKNGGPALFRATKVYKGPKGQRLFKVAMGMTSCHMHYDKGYRGRIVLFGGPRTYDAVMYVSSMEDINEALGLPRASK